MCGFGITSVRATHDQCRVGECYLLATYTTAQMHRHAINAVDLLQNVSKVLQNAKKNSQIRHSAECPAEKT